MRRTNNRHMPKNRIVGSFIILFIFGVAVWPLIVHNTLQGHPTTPCHPVKRVLQIHRQLEHGNDKDHRKGPVDSERWIEKPAPTSTVGGAIIGVADAKFAKRYANQILTQQCVAHSNNFEYVLIDPKNFSSCNRYSSFFFKKHCAVSEYLKTKPIGFVGIVTDTDVVGNVHPSISLKPWLDRFTNVDIMFYERSWNFEITAGNYFVRNTNYSRHFLLAWADFEFRRPSGFSSADNGAIHQLLLEEIGLVYADKCGLLYKQLVARVDNLNPYFRFVACTKYLLGPPRKWIIDHPRRTGSITILNRYHGWCVDGQLVDHRLGGYHAFVHGIKDQKKMNKFYNISVYQARNINKVECTLGGNSKRLSYQSKEDAGRVVFRHEKYWFRVRHGASALVPRWSTMHCIKSFSCEPMENYESVWTNPLMAYNGTLETMVVDYFGKAPMRNLLQYETYNEMNGVDEENRNYSAIANNISFVIPASMANVPADLPRLMNTIDAQTIFPREVIIVVSGAGDHLCSKLKTILELNVYNHFEVLLQCVPLEANKAALRNLGVTLSRGEWVSFIDAEDQIRPKRTAKIAKHIASNGMVRLILHGYMIPGHHYSKTRKIVFGKSLFDLTMNSQSLHTWILPNIIHSQPTVHRSVLASVRFREEDVYNDKADSVFVRDVVKFLGRQNRRMIFDDAPLACHGNKPSTSDRVSCV